MTQLKKLNKNDNWPLKDNFSLGVFELCNRRICTIQEFMWNLSDDKLILNGMMLEWIFLFVCLKKAPPALWQYM